MLVKNLKTNVVWAVTERHGAALLRSEEFEEVQAPNQKKQVEVVPLTELPEYEKITANQIKDDLTIRGIAYAEKAEKQELYALLKEAFEKVGD
ncbi:hypothetical protein ACQKII_14035 [Lysinibacillus sp. NPDC048646]|uniref:hypothetical protein n=1 Tax=Lysinibacillus sp. NPDC048646 TaxID=3390574 RepID=UPI003CFF3881